MRYPRLVGKGFQLPSGRVIAIGRVMLATLFLIAIWVDVTQPAKAPATTYSVLVAYALFAAALLVLTWRNWWLDAQLAGPAHAVDIILFTVLVVLTESYTSPSFTFFMFLLLAAAIRWSWHATALTAMLVTLLYMIAGLLVAPSGAEFELQRFVIRTGHLVILSLILIWFGANRWRARFTWRDEGLGHPVLGESPLETGLRAAMNGVRASAGAFVWRRDGGGDFAGVAIRRGDAVAVTVPGPALADALASTPFVYDLARNRALRKDVERNLTELVPGDAIAAPAASALALREGLAIPIRSEGGEGMLFLESLPSLSTDHIDLGEQLAADIAAHIQRHALLRAAEESAEARSRMTLARDLHDSIVQFLAGAAFRLEAIKRSDSSGRDVEPEIEELKQLMLQEQRELRSSITALRSGSHVAYDDLARDLQALGERLSRQWGVRCAVSARPADMTVPTRLHLDALQLMREAVANAVRHAEAKSVDIKLEADSGELRLEFVNDGSAARPRSGRLETPMSLKERVDQAGGTLDFARGMGVTKVAIALPLGGRRP